ncbi:Chorismate synthase 1, chloroplastic [Vitis vinifera]|uniref:chorismate synthase n=1 Tax=Vitis vinifera TaxID=29760 RepID=A0A438D9K1_VITVI|nr:Chorismate synthase 1, chloroplastic [Vitis vinifera]
MASSLSSKPFLTSPSTDGASGFGSLCKLSFPSVRYAIRPTHRRTLEIQAAGSTYGTYFRVTTYGESHGGGVGCIIDGCPPRLPLTEADMQIDLDRRRPGQSRITTPRKETDTCRIYSGVAEGMTTGSPIMVNVPNTDQRGNDYTEMSKAYRPSHADATYDFKYGVRSVQGGGRSSARETIGRVAAGAVAKKILKIFLELRFLLMSLKCTRLYFLRIWLTTKLWHSIRNERRWASALARMGMASLGFPVTTHLIESNIVRCPDPEYAEKMIAAIDAVRVRGDSVGGVVTCIVRNVPRGLGSPVFDKLEAELAKLLCHYLQQRALNLAVVLQVEKLLVLFGTFMTGSEHNDEFFTDAHGRIRTRTNRSGGIQGGISNGEIINIRIGFKPTSTIGKKQHTVTRDKQETELIARGRHDPCVVPRADTCQGSPVGQDEHWEGGQHPEIWVPMESPKGLAVETVPMVEAAVALVLVDQLMAQYAQCELFPINPALQEPLEFRDPELAGTHI